MHDLFIKFIADGLLGLIVLIALPFIGWRLRGRFWEVAPIVTMAGLSSLLIAKIMSMFYQPEIARPFLRQGLAPGAAYIDNPGFPSDHALLATVTVVAVYALTKNRFLGIGLLVLVIVMGIGRVLALVHTPLDVAGGMVAGLLGAFWYRKLTK